MKANKERVISTDSSRLLRRLREVLGGANLKSQQKLDQVVQIVASEMHCEVCSIYANCHGNVLVLFATEGLNPFAVHFTRVRVGEGVIGDVAANDRPVILSDVRSHSNFAYRPETGEEDLKGFAGVPLLREGKTVGVLAVQSSEKKLFSYGEVELLQTIGMVVAELMTVNEFPCLEQVGPKQSVPWLPSEYTGLSLNPGLASGIAVFHQLHPIYAKKSAVDIHMEKQRLQKAIIDMQSSLRTLFAREDIDKSGAHQDVLEVYKMLAFDKGWHQRLNMAIENGLSAESAVDTVLNDLKQTFAKPKDSLWKARIADFEDLSVRLLQFLTGKAQRAKLISSKEKMILIAKNMGPAELLDYPKGAIGALVLEDSSQSAHVSIVARAMDIPVVARLPGILLQIEPGDHLLIDGDRGKIVVRPNSNLMADYEAKLKARQETTRRIKAARDTPSVTKDGLEIKLSINAGLPVDVDKLEETGAQGVGLYRTEIPFMLEDSLPDVKTQCALYKDIISRAHGKQVIFRTLDIGGDKLLPYLEIPEAENPAMGWRAVRISLDRPGLFRNQIRALLQAAAGNSLSLMIPMVTTTEEFRRARKIIDLEIERMIHQEVQLPHAIKVGTMLEVPALAYDLKTLLPEVDFVSIGTNDLIQFFFAVDRSNIMLTNLYDPLSIGFLSFLSEIIAACKREKVALQLCGEFASSPLEAMILIGLGFRSLSMSPASLGRVKLMLQSLEVNKFKVYLDRILIRARHNIRDACKSYAQDHGIII